MKGRIDNLEWRGRACANQRKKTAKKKTRESKKAYKRVWEDKKGSRRTPITEEYRGRRPL